MQEQSLEVVSMQDNEFPDESQQPVQIELTNFDQIGQPGFNQIQPQIRGDGGETQGNIKTPKKYNRRIYEFCSIVQVVILALLFSISTIITSIITQARDTRDANGGTAGLFISQTLGYPKVSQEFFDRGYIDGIRVKIDGDNIQFFRLYDFLNDSAETYKEVPMNETILSHDPDQCYSQYDKKDDDEIFYPCIAEYGKGGCKDESEYTLKWGDEILVGVYKGFYQFQCHKSNEDQQSSKKLIKAELLNIEYLLKRVYKVLDKRDLLNLRLNSIEQIQNSYVPLVNEDSLRGLQIKDIKGSCLENGVKIRALPRFDRLYSIWKEGAKSHEVYKDSWVPFDDIEKVNEVFLSRKNMLNQVPTTVLARNKEKMDIQVLRGLDFIEIDASKNEGSCQLDIVGEYYCYSRYFWQNSRVMMMTMSWSFFLGGFLLNFQHIGLVRITPFQKTTLILTASLEIFDLITDIWQTYTAKYFLVPFKNMMVFSAFIAPITGIVTWMIVLRDEPWFKDTISYWDYKKEAQVIESKIQQDLLKSLQIQKQQNFQTKCSQKVKQASNFIVNLIGRVIWSILFFLDIHILENVYMDSDQRVTQLVVVGVLENYTQLAIVTITLWLNGSTVTQLQGLSMLASISTLSRTLGQAASVYLKQIFKFSNTKEKCVMVRSVLDFIAVIFAFVNVQAQIYNLLKVMLNKDDNCHTKKFEENWLLEGQTSQVDYSYISSAKRLSQLILSSMILAIIANLQRFYRNCVRLYKMTDEDIISAQEEINKTIKYRPPSIFKKFFKGQFDLQELQEYIKKEQ